MLADKVTSEMRVLSAGIAPQLTLEVLALCRVIERDYIKRPRLTSEEILGESKSPEDCA